MHAVTVEIDIAHTSDRTLEKIDQAMNDLRALPGVQINGWDE